jgi:stearoyl-CoA desaturase (delta-9 desaturase)
METPSAPEKDMRYETEVLLVPPNSGLWKFLRVLVIFLPPLGVIAAMFTLWGGWFRPVDLILFTVLYLATGFGITVGFHRLFTHRSFKASPAATWTLGVLGSMAIEGPLDWWVATHRRHHRHSDEQLDPHSPHAGRKAGIIGSLAAFLHAHVGWSFRRECTGTDTRRYAPDILGNARLMTISRLFPVWVIAGLLLPAAIGWLVDPTWRGALLGLLWGGLVRVFMVHHVTWSVNSICHLYGTKDHDTGDESRNNALFGVLALGEGWHNNHHAFPASARHGLAWWQLDLSWLLIRLLALFGAARDIKTASPSRAQALPHGSGS